MLRKTLDELDELLKSGDTYGIVDFADLLSKKEESYAKIIKTLQSIIIDSRNVKQITRFAKIIDTSDIGLLCNAVVKYGNDCDAYYFACDLNRQKMPFDSSSGERLTFDCLRILQEKICKNLSPRYITSFAMGIKNANIDLLTDAIVSCGTVKNLYQFSSSVTGFDSSKLCKAICIKSIKEFEALSSNICLKNCEEFARDSFNATVSVIAGYVYRFIFNANNLSSSDIELLTDTICALNNSKYIYLSAMIDGMNIDLLQEKILQLDDKSKSYADNLYNFAKNVKSANIERFQSKIIDLNIHEVIYNFARDVKGVDIGKLQDHIIKQNSSTYIYQFARNVKGADMESLEAAIIETHDVKTIISFARDIDGVDVQKLQNSMISSKDILMFIVEVQNAKLNNILIIFYLNFLS